MADKSVDYQGSFFVADASTVPIVWRVTAAEESGYTQRYSENPVSEEAIHYSLVDGEYVVDPDGDYIQDPAHPGQYILRVYEKNSSGAYVYSSVSGKYVDGVTNARLTKYEDLATVLANSGVRFIDG